MNPIEADLAARHVGPCISDVCKVVLDCARSYATDRPWYTNIREEESLLYFWNKDDRREWRRKTSEEKGVWLCKQLRYCHDILPHADSVAEEFGLQRATYASLARVLRKEVPRAKRNRVKMQPNELRA